VTAAGGFCPEIDGGQLTVASVIEKEALAPDVAARRVDNGQGEGGGDGGVDRVTALPQDLEPGFGRQALRAYDHAVARLYWDQGLPERKGGRQAEP